jgi:tRNA dimethylallyltransferase
LQYLNKSHHLEGRAGGSTAHVVAIFGPTASGKSAVAEAVADRIGGVLISADSAQVYRGLPILTNQPARPTQLVAIWELDHEASVGEYQRLAHAEIDRALAQGRTPIVVGGTGLYLRAALAELELPPPPERGARARWGHVYDRLGPERTHALLATHDAAASARVHPNDRRRVIRALELAETGESLAPTTDRLWSEAPRRPTVVFGLDVHPPVLALRIEERARRMLEAGARAEALAALAGPLSTTAAKIIGLREAAELAPEAALEAIALRTRRYAAYQRKWMRRIPGLIRLDANRPPEDVADELLEMAGAGQRLPADG